MQLYPAIDMLDGNAVRLRQGRRDDVTIFGNPVDLAAKWREQGATYLHLVDLTAAFDGQTKHLPLIREVIRAFGGNVELGGGLRTMADIALRIEAGVTRCIIGTAAIEHPELVKEACRAFPGQIAVGLDARVGGNIRADRRRSRPANAGHGRRYPHLHRHQPRRDDAGPEFRRNEAPD
mgnify:CR=1 FL=1